MEEDRPSGFDAISSLSRREGAIMELRRAIVKGVLVPGERITEASLSAQLGVSRPTMREAVNQLSREGLLVQEPYRGMRVAELGLDEHLDLARTRHALDMLAIDAILEDTSGGRLASLDAHWRAFSAVEEHPDPLVRHEAHIAFHRGIWAASENKVILRVWPVIEAHITVSLAQDQSIRADPARASTRHRALIDAIHGGNRATIEDAFRTHTIASAHELVVIIQQHEVSAPRSGSTQQLGR